ncbi:hypothetical protein QYS49_28380 [Marivirga salinae]|uniref:Uncharacterized protein n=1 Tax=Marivirga salinarum TaxID=3059078 RepID=A0AA49GC98_9BACT|nr:hypothetical protein [Marivirga sp. BDSF4-3]WKK75415.1 hypothetical protein QYS49_28380 [Marivirga sp. BDSF4-3]
MKTIKPYYKMHFRQKYTFGLIFVILILHFTNDSLAQNTDQKDRSISYFAGSGEGGQDFLWGRHHYIGIDKSVWRFLYASSQLSYMHATNQRYFNIEDVYVDEHSYNLILQLDANLRINLGPITITPHAGISSRYSDEVRYLHGSKTPPGQPIKEDKSYRQEAFSGLSFGKAFGLNLELMIFDHTSIGIRTDIQEYNHSPTSLSTFSFQIRTNFPKLINEFKKP